MLPYHVIAHDICAERLARVEADWRIVTARAEPAGPAADEAAARHGPRRRPLAATVRGTLRRFLGRRRLRPA